jgi:hypothetical protein
VLHFTILTINTLYTVFIGHTLPDLYSGLLRNRALPKPFGVFFKILARGVVFISASVRTRADRVAKINRGSGVSQLLLALKREKYYSKK